MRRLRQRPTPGLVQPKEQMPMSEGIIPLDARGRRNWSRMSDAAVVEFAKSFMEEKGITRSAELHKADNGLYIVLCKRKLLDGVKFEEKRRKGRDWASMSDDDLVGLTKRFMEERGITRRDELQRADSGLYTVLRKRKLLDGVKFEEKCRKARNWTSMSDEGIVDFTKKFMEENGITRSVELQKADGGLYGALRKRKLLDQVGFEERLRYWGVMSDEKLVAFAQRFADEKGIGDSGKLKKADNGLYIVLRRRNLLNRVFAPLENEKRKQAIQQVFDAMKEFGK